MVRAAHAILVRTDMGEGDHWECVCRRWTFDSPNCLSIEEVRGVLEGSYAKHKLVGAEPEAEVSAD